MRSEKEIKKEICRLFRLMESMQLAKNDILASQCLNQIYRLEWVLGDKLDGSWAAFQRYLLGT